MYTHRLKNFCLGILGTENFKISANDRGESDFYGVNM